jgi:TonB-linked SusC/RagA family outer membrane protein
MSQKIIYSLSLIWALLSGSIIYAQTVKGTVSDANGPLPQASVVVKGTSTSTVTDLDGNYTISNVGSNATLIFSYIGYVAQEQTANGDSTINVVLVEDAQKLNEVIVTGYVGQRKTSITGAVAQVDMEDLSKTRIPDVAQALQGQVAGVFVAASTGAPGDGVQIRIRGQGTLNNNDVLYVVDGVPTRDITFLNQNDVKSMTVLKDAAAGAIYGSRAAGGVVIITTKKGVVGKTSLDVEAFTGFQFATNLPHMLNADQYLSMEERAWNNTTGHAADAVNPYLDDRNTRTDLADTNWLKELFTTGIANNLQVSASGATDKVQYLVSGGYYGVDGIIVENNDKYKRVNVRANVNVNVSDRFTVGTNMQISFQKQDRLSSSGDAPGVIRHALIRPPVIPVYKDVNDPTYTTNDPYTDLPFYTGPNNRTGYLRRYEESSNPLAIVHFTDDIRETFQTFGNVYAELALLNDKSLKLRSNLGADIRFLHNKAFNENYGDPNVDDPSYIFYNLGRNNRPNGLNEDRSQNVTFTWTNTLNYVKTLNDVHSINALLGVERIDNKAAGIGGSRQNYDNTTDPFRYLEYGGLGSDLLARPGNAGSQTSWALLSYFASGTYGYADRYFVTGTVRADASSRFGPNNKWGYFPSASAGWIVSNENFMKDVTWLSNLKFRGSWGQAGNQEIPDFQWLQLYTTGPNPRLRRLGNPDIKWETTTQTNIGLDIAILENRLNLSADYFSKVTDDILLDFTPPGLVGRFDPTSRNSASVTNKGFELALGLQNYDHAFKYGINANLATLKNNVTKLNENVPYLDSGRTRSRTQVGQPIGSYYGLQFDGIYQNAAEISTQLFLNDDRKLPGDIRFKDLNGDGQINDDDRTFIGSSIPTLTYGFAFNCSYSNFDLSFLLQGVDNVDRYNDLKQILDYDSRPFNSTTAILGSWNGEGTSNTIPRVTQNDNGGSKISSVFVEDASYLRLKNIEIGYTFKDSLPGINNLRIYASAQNLLTFTKYTGLDPESTSLIDQGTYPQATSIIFGVRVKL